jgi:hypothetical protein
MRNANGKRLAKKGFKQSCFCELNEYKEMGIRKIIIR